jgi:hypothetical protein
MLVAIGLLVILVGAMFAFLFDMLSARARALETAGRQTAATTLVENLEGDLSVCLVGDATNGAGIEGDNERVRILVRGVPGALAERGSADPDVVGDLQVVEYRHDPWSRRVETRKGPLDEPGDFAPIGAEIARLRFRYHDGSNWLDQFDSLGSGTLPVAVEVMVWFHPWPGDVPTEEEEAESEFGGGFDELAFARESDLDRYDEPAPDRFRVITVPDARPDEGPESLAQLP